jgi:hypothetical protein
MRIIASIVILAAMAASGTTAVHAEEGNKKYTKEVFKSEVKAVGKGAKDAAVDVGHQVAGGTKKAYNSTKDKVKKDVKDGKPGDGSLATKNNALPAVTSGRKPN